MLGYVYQITVSGKSYIGMTARTVGIRVREHATDKRRHMYKTLRNKKYTVKTLRRVRFKKRKELFKVERYYMRKLLPELNIWECA